jgi:protein-L-isoaspartate(D-aspartate) O-methyltransferase
MAWGKHDALVDGAVRAVRRELFLPVELRARAAEDAALPIGCAQTISQPSLVRFMTGQLDLTPSSRVLEIGTGSGYQTAILAEVAATVFTIELLPELGATAHALLTGLGYRNIEFRIGDGALGWPEAAPFGAVIVTAAAVRLPPALLEQLAPGGRLVAPIGPPDGDQSLVRVDKDARGELRQRDLCGVRFVPLVTKAIA